MLVRLERRLISTSACLVKYLASCSRQVPVVLRSLRRIINAVLHAFAFLEDGILGEGRLDVRAGELMRSV